VPHSKHAYGTVPTLVCPAACIRLPLASLVTCIPRVPASSVGQFVSPWVKERARRFILSKSYHSLLTFFGGFETGNCRTDAEELFPACISWWNPPSRDAPQSYARELCFCPIDVPSYVCSWAKRAMPSSVLMRLGTTGPTWLSDGPVPSLLWDCER
jgi:hypothetical protein